MKRNPAIDEYMQQQGLSFGTIKANGETRSATRKPNMAERATYEARKAIESHRERQELHELYNYLEV